MRQRRRGTWDRDLGKWPAPGVLQRWVLVLVTGRRKGPHLDIPLPPEAGELNNLVPEMSRWSKRKTGQEPLAEATARSQLPNARIPERPPARPGPALAPRGVGENPEQACPPWPAAPSSRQGPHCRPTPPTARITASLSARSTEAPFLAAGAPGPSPVSLPASL